MANVSSSNTTTLYSTTQQVPIATGAPVATGTVNDANFTTLYGQVTSAPNPNGNQVIQNLLVTGNEQINGNLTVLGTTTLNNTVINGMTWPLADGLANQVLTTDGAGNLYWSSVSSLLSYTFDAAATTGGADINLTDNSSNVQTVTLLEGTGVTITVPQSDEVEIAIGQDVATTANPQFAGATLGNVTVGVATDNTITTTSGDLVLDSATNQVTIDANATVVGDLAVNGGDITTTSLTPNLWNETGLTYVLLGPQEWDWTGNTYVYNARATANNTSTNTVATPLYVQRNVSGGGTPAVGVGSSIIYNVETQQTVFVDAAALEIVSTDVTPGSNDFDFKLKLIENGVLGTKLTLTSAGDLTVTGNITGAGTTMGNITVGVATDNTISTTTGDLILDSATNTVSVDANLTTPLTTFNLIDTTATTVNAFGAATTLNLGYDGAGPSITNINTGLADSSPSSKTINIGTGSAPGTNTKIDIGSILSNSGVNLFGITRTYNNDIASSYAEVNSTTGTVYPFSIVRYDPGTPTAGDETGIRVYNQDSSGNLKEYANINIRIADPTAGTNDGEFLVKLQDAGTLSQRLKVTNDGDIWVYGDIVNGQTGQATITFSGQDVILPGDLAVNGGDITTNQTTFNLLDTTATTVNAFGAATTVNIGAATGFTTIDNNIVKGAVRAPFLANNDVYGLNAAGSLGRGLGISVDNSADTSKRSNIVVRAYSGGTGTAPRNPIIGETARNTAASPYRLSSGDNILEFHGQGYYDDLAGNANWSSVNASGLPPLILRGRTRETWTGQNNLGTEFQILTMVGNGVTPAANNYITTSFNGITGNLFTSDAHTFQTRTVAQGGAGITQVSIDNNGNVTITGDLRINGNDIVASDGNTNITMTSNTLTTLAGDLAVNGGDITTTQTTASVFDATATTINAFGAATTIDIGAATGTTTINNDLTVDGSTTIKGSTSGYSTFSAPATGSNLTYVLPGVAGAANEVLTNDGSGNLSWALPGGGGSTFGNITVGIVTDNTISTTTGDLVLDSSSNNVSVDADLITPLTTFNLINTTATTVNAFGDATTVNIGNSAGNVIVAGDLQVTGNDIKASDGNTAITLEPVASFNPNTQIVANLFKGDIRNATSESNGDIWQQGASGYRGISVDNSQNTAKRPGYILRGYSGGASAPRVAFVGETARGTAASPVRLSTNDNMFELFATGYYDNGSGSAGWMSDANIAPGMLMRARASENWLSASNMGTEFQILLTPNGVTQTSGGGAYNFSLILNPTAGNSYRSDSHTFVTRSAGAGGTNTTQLTIDSSGNVTVTGDLAVNGGDITTTQTTASVFNTNATTVNAFGAATTVSIGNSAGNVIVAGDLQISGNDIKNSTGDITITMNTGSGALTTFAGDIQINGNEIYDSNGDIRVYYNTDIDRVFFYGTRNQYYYEDVPNASTIYFNPGDKSGATQGERYTQFNMINRNTNSDTHSLFSMTTYNFDNGTGNYSATLADEIIGRIGATGQYGTGTNPQTNQSCADVEFRAAENFTASANGGRVVFKAVEIGTTNTLIDIIAVDSDNAYIRSENITFQDTANNTLMDIDTNGNVNITGDLTVGGSTVYDYTAYSDGRLSTTSTSLTTLDSWATATYQSAGYQITVKDTVSGDVQVTRIDMFHAAGTAYINQFSNMTSTADLATFSATISGGNAVLEITPASANNTQFTFSRTLTEV